MKRRTGTITVYQIAKPRRYVAELRIPNRKTPACQTLELPTYMEAYEVVHRVAKDNDIEIANPLPDPIFKDPNT